VKVVTTPIVQRHRASRVNRSANRAGADLPYDFVELSECLAGQTDRQLGYFGEGRFVAFRYEPRAEDVMWRDERSFGIATGAWQEFMDQVQPLADLYDVNVGSNDRAAEHVLVFDRTRLTAYFAPRDSAEAFLDHRKQVLPETLRARPITC
jgi:hypothetical protein